MRPQSFIGLPDNEEFNARIHEAYDLIASSYDAASLLLSRETTDYIRLRIHADRLSSQILPLLEALECELHNDGWITEAATAVIALINDLRRSSSQIVSMYVQTHSST